MRESLAEYEKYGEWWPRVCERVAEGAKVTDICREYALYVGLFRAWVFADPGREAQYQDALDARAAAKRKRPPRKRLMPG